MRSHLIYMVVSPFLSLQEQNRGRRFLPMWKMVMGLAPGRRKSIVCERSFCKGILGTTFGKGIPGTNFPSVLLVGRSYRSQMIITGVTRSNLTGVEIVRSHSSLTVHAIRSPHALSPLPTNMLLSLCYPYQDYFTTNLDEG
jgi:hypothetical protein